MDFQDAVASSPTAEHDEESAAARRRSGRVSKKPDLLVDQLAVSAKRKRTADGADAGSDVESGAADDDDDIDMDDESDESDGDDGDDEGNARRKRGKARKAGSAKPRAAKKPKHDANGNEQSIPIRSSKGSGKSRSKKAVRFSTAAEAGGLFGEFSGRLVSCTDDCSRIIRDRKVA
jgi:cohesin complex subunit SA-1/2